MKLTRRKLAAAMWTAPAVALAQTQPATTPVSQDEELKAATERLWANLKALQEVKVPMSSEPAFQFKA